MIKLFWMLPVIALLLVACTLPAEQSDPTPAATMPSAMATAPAETTLPPAAQTEPVISLLPGIETGKSLSLRNPGKVRIGYQGNRRSVHYITSVEDLPDEEALASYDAAFFEDHALLVVVETVSSGSIRLELGSVLVSGDSAMVKLDREMSGDVGTADMATWLLWAEVDRGLDYEWSLEGSGSRIPNSSKY